MHLARFPRARFAPSADPARADAQPHAGGSAARASASSATTAPASRSAATRPASSSSCSATRSRQGADTLITHGAVQSNHVRQTAAAACRYGLRCEAAARAPGRGSTDPTTRRTGNVLLDRLFGAGLRVRRGRHRHGRGLAEVAERGPRAGRPALRDPGRRLERRSARSATSTPRSSCCSRRTTAGLRIDGVVHRHRQRRHPGGPGGRARGRQCRRSPVIGICVRRPAEVARSRPCCGPRRATAAHLGLPGRDRAGAGDGERRLCRRRLRHADGRHARGDPAVRAEPEGLLLDPVYTGKAMAGLIDLVPQGLLPRRPERRLPPHRRRRRAVRLRIRLLRTGRGAKWPTIWCARE